MGEAEREIIPDTHLSSSLCLRPRFLEPGEGDYAIYTEPYIGLLLYESSACVRG
jgi:hypothetical protein